MQKLQPTKPPRFPMAGYHPLSVLSGLTKTQVKVRHTYQPMPVEMHNFLAWAAGVSRRYSNHHNKFNRAHGAVSALSTIECVLDDIIQTETTLDKNRPWALYYKWGEGDMAFDEACDPIYSLMLIMGLLEHTPDLQKMDPRYTYCLNLADYAIGKVARAKARTKH